MTGFGGPPAHIALLRDLVVHRRGWMDAQGFEDANAACQLLPGPASTQLAIFCAHRAGGWPGAIAGGFAFVLPAVILVTALSVLFLAQSPPAWVRGAGAGAGAAVAAVALRVGLDLLGPSFARAREDGGREWRWFAYLALGGAAAALVGPYLVIALVACGALELALRRGGAGLGLHAAPLAALLPLAAASGGLGALAWTALKVGALSFGGGFVIVPLMQGDAVEVYGWMTDAEFLNAVALGQVTPGPVVATVAAVGYAAHGVGGAMLASLVAFLPSFTLVLLGGGRFERLRANAGARSFLDGAGPAAIGAILGATVPLTAALGDPWQLALLAVAALYLLALRRGVVAVLLGAGAIGALLGVIGAPLPG